ncbi:hypothetical protein K2173_027230 [Erythroxylum novogranatense]|uniref:Hexosyltransferase n=1 Tax=Erythroxylum novogranatense TaxID=1862640 RepID=A0AAV8U2B8_9ROSI|nr:hypothetical protein K2173_027230 [Erythroxylum novogranatense]
MAYPRSRDSSRLKLFIPSLLFLSLSLMVLSLSLKSSVPFNKHKPFSMITAHKWFDDLVASGIGSKKLKIGLVNVDDDTQRAYSNMHGLGETVSIDFETVSKDLKWDDFFPEWIEEDGKWGPAKCPDIPMPTTAEVDLDVIVARVPCGREAKKKGIRDVYRLQVNLVVANLVVANGWVSPDFYRTVYAVFISSCGPMEEIFRCEDLVTRTDSYWVYKPELRRLKQQMLMPVGSCQIASPGQEGYIFGNGPLSAKFAYATLLHSSEAYVCGAIALAQSILQSNSTHDLVLLHDSSLSPKSLKGLKKAGWKTRQIEPIRSPFAKKGSYNEWNYSKLRVWQLIEYEKVIFVDADLLVLKNIDKFFFYPQLSASPNEKVLFNSGFMVIEPSSCTFEDLMKKTSKLASYNDGDQGFLNEFFTWWHRLPKKVNFLKVFSSGSRQIPDNLYTLHFLGLKPWMCYKDYDCNWDMVARHQFASDSAHKKWWQVYKAMPKELHEYCGLTKQLDARIRKWRRIAKNVGLPDGHWKIKVSDPRRYHFVG